MTRTVTVSVGHESRSRWAVPLIPAAAARLGPTLAIRELPQAAAVVVAGPCPTPIQLFISRFSNSSYKCFRCCWLFLILNFFG